MGGLASPRCAVPNSGRPTYGGELAKLARLFGFERRRMGRSGAAIAYDRYGRLMPHNEAETAGLLDAYLVAAAR